MKTWTVIIRQSRAGRDTIESRCFHGPYDSDKAWHEAAREFRADLSEILAIVPGNHAENVVTRRNIVTEALVEEY